MKIKRISSFTAALFLSLSSLLVLYVPRVAAATVTWDGGGADNNFSTAANWSADAVPSSGDSLIFPDSAPADSLEIVNDMTLSIAGINFTGSSQSFEITGSPLTLTGGITSDSDSHLYVSLTLGASITIASNSAFFRIGEYGQGHTVNMSIYDLIFDTAPGENVLGSSDISGSGDITKNGAGLIEMGTGSNFSGDLFLNGGEYSVYEQGQLGASSGGTVVGNGATLRICPYANLTIAEPITLDGSGAAGVEKIALGNCGGAGDSFTAELAGSVQLQSAVQIEGLKHSLKITGPLSGATISVKTGEAVTLVIASSNNTSQTPNGTQEAEELVTTIAVGDDQPSLGFGVPANQTYIVNGIRGAVIVNSGGTLKGTGTVGNLNVSSGGKLAPGHSPGCLNSGNLIFDSGSVYEFEVGGTTACTEYDQTKVTGTVTLNPGVGSGTGPVLNVIRFNDFKPSAGQTFMIIENDGTDAVLNGTFNNLAEGATFEVDGYVLRISYVGGTGNDVVLTVVTVPATPNTGFGLLLNNPIAIFAGTALGAAGILAIARKQKLAFQRSR